MVSSKKGELKESAISVVLENFGKYHLMQYLYISLAALFVTMFNVNYVFVAGDMKYRCRVPGCDDPGSTAEFPVWWPDASIDRCSAPVLNNSQLWLNHTCSNASFTGGLTHCSDWIYESHDTIIADLDLACEPVQVSLIGTIHNVGFVLSNIIAGWASDRFGRKPVLVFCSISSLIGTFKTFATTYSSYVTIEFFEALLCGGVYASGCILMVEISSTEKRLLAGVIFAYAIYLGEMIFAAITMAVPYWKHLIYIVYTPTILFVSFIYIVGESPRWLLFNGKVDQAKKTIRTISKMNKMNINLDELKEMDESMLKDTFKMGDCEVQDTYRVIFSSKEIWKRLIVCGVGRVTVSFVYYGMMINSVYLPGNKHTNFMLAAVMSFPGELLSLYLMNRIGRKLPLLVGFLLCGVCSILSGFVPDDTIWLKISMFLVGKVLVSLCFTGAVTYNMELFPTSARGTLLGICSFAQGFGEMLAPSTPLLALASPLLPPVVFGVSTIVAGLLMVLTPETKGSPLLDTVAQVEAGVRKTKENHS